MSNNLKKGILVGLTAAAFAVSGVSMRGLEDRDGAINILEKDGRFVNVEVGGVDSFSCGKGDVFRTHFQAETAEGKRIEGTVCRGFFKGATIRLGGL